MTDYSIQLRSALMLSKDMLHAAYENDWYLVDELEIKRQQVFKLMARFTNSEHAELAVKKLQQLIEINNELVKLSRAEKQVCTEKYFKNRNNKKACQAYFSI